MDNSTNPMQITACVLFLVFSVYFYNKKLYIISAINAIAFANYAAIICQIGETKSEKGVTDYIPRYLDWIITTPLLLLTLIMRSGLNDPKKIAYFLIIDVMMIYTGYLASMTSNYTYKMIMFFVSIFFLLVLFFNIFLLRPPLVLFLFLFASWMIYPILWGLHETQKGNMTDENYTYSISALDVFSKIGYGLIFAL